MKTTTHQEPRSSLQPLIILALGITKLYILSGLGSILLLFVLLFT